MNTKMFVNLPVYNLAESMDFFSKIGFSFNAQFTDENAACMVIGPDNYVMLLVEPFFKSFINKEIADTTESTEVLVALSVDSREEVDSMLERAIIAGGVETRAPQDQGYMYGRDFEDIDGHIWEIFWMDQALVE